MPKSQYINPEDLRKYGKITFEEISCNAYRKTVEEEREIFSDSDLIHIFRDMSYIRNIEKMLLCIKDDGDRKSTRLNSSHSAKSRMPSSA